MMAESMTRKPWYRRLPVRLSVRSLIVLVLAIGGGLGWIAHRARVQRRAVVVITAAGGTVGYDWAITGGYLAGGTRLPRLKWLVDTLGVDYLGNVTRVYFHAPNLKELDDEVLEEVGRLASLEDLQIGAWQVTATDAGLAHLGGLSRLKSLGLFLNDKRRVDLSFLDGLTRLERLQLVLFPMTDTDLAHVSDLTRLNVLSIISVYSDNRSNSSITDAGLAALEPLRGLERLQLDGTRVTTAGLNHLRSMTRLESLSLYGSDVTSLAPLSHLVGLKNLNLNQTPITDDGLAPILGSRGLTHLDLQGSRIGDPTLSNLSGLTSLQRLDVARTHVTTQGLTRAARPGLTICP